MTASVATAETTEYGPWNPGIQSQLPSRLAPLATIYRPENVFRSYQQVRELRDLTGLDFTELLVFRPERLVVHELLIRVTSELSVPDGSEVDDLGVSFRQMTHAILTKHIAPHMPEIVGVYQAIERRLAGLITAEFSQLLAPTPAATPPVPAQGARRLSFGFLRFQGREMPRSPRHENDRDREQRLLKQWAEKAGSTTDSVASASYPALIRVASAMLAKHGRIWGELNLLASVVTGIASNCLGTETISELVDPWFRKAAQAEGYQVLPFQKQPVVMNTKGASASGKSTMRPYQKRLASETGVDWQQFALISPDIWRRCLLDFDSLGDDYKYFGMFTGEELAIVDSKLDRHMGRKGERAEIPHLLIDRFRFDSFSADVDEANTTLMTRFADLVYLFFVITPPHATVDRAWQRGLRVGRYKAVDDLLAHNVEAFTGMPDLFFTWAMRTNKRVHYEFLDNGVPEGQRPRTVAFGWNQNMTILDVKCMLDIERYRKIDVNATKPEDLYPGPQALTPQSNTRFLERCVRQFTNVDFASRDTGLIYARMESGRPTWVDSEALKEAMTDTDTRAGILAVAPDALTTACDPEPKHHSSRKTIESERIHILGQWGA